MEVAIQGALGSFHHEVACALDARATIVPQQTFADVFEAVQTGKTAYGLCAIENTLYGPINEVYRLLEQHDIWIVRDIRLQIAQHLIGPSVIPLEELANSTDVRVLSQAPALAQVQQWLAKHLPRAIVEATPDTAGSVQTIMGLAQPHTLAVAGRLAAATYGGIIIAKNIQDNPHNYTRFILFSKTRESNRAATCGFMIVKTKPDTLAHALQAFADAGSNLIEVNSYPVPDNTRRYALYIDYTLPKEGSVAIIHTLEAQGYTVKLLGEYSSGPTIQAM